MIEQTLERIAVALEQIAENKFTLATAQRATTAPAEDEAPVEVVEVKPEKKKSKPKKKKAEKVEEKVMAAGDLISPRFTKEDVKAALKANVLSHDGEDASARAIFDAIAEGTTLSTLSEEHYGEVIDRLKAETNE